MINKKLIELQEQLDFDYDLVSVELDTCPNRLRYISNADLSDAISKDSFDNFFNEIKSSEAVVVSFNDNTDMYEVGEDNVVIIIHDSLKAKYILFDIQDAKKIENMIFKPNKTDSVII